MGRRAWTRGGFQRYLVVVLTDDLRDLCAELVRDGLLSRVRLALDYFDASLNRIAAWVVGARALLQALLQALLEPISQLRELEESGDKAGWLALREAAKSLPHGAVWDAYCLKMGTPPSDEWLAQVRAYESKVLGRRR